LRAGARWVGPALFLASAAAEIADNPGEAARIVTEATGGYLAGEGATALCVLLAAPTGWGVVGCAIGGAVVGGAIGSTVAGSAYDRARHFPSVVPGSMMAGGGLHGQMRRDEERTREQFHAPGTTSGGARPPFRDAPEPIASPLTGSVEIDRREARNRIAQLSDDARAALARGLLPLQVRPLVPAGRDARTVEQWARAALEGAGYRLELQPPRQEPQGYGAGMELGFRSRGAAAEAAELQLHTAAPVAAPSPPAEGPETIGRGAH
jgi:hypothetical protein